jgi:hypothetical protein
MLRAAKFRYVACGERGGIGVSSGGDLGKVNRAEEIVCY